VKRYRKNKKENCTRTELVTKSAGFSRPAQGLPLRRSIFFIKKKSSTKVVYYHFAPEKEGKELWYIISISTLVLYKALLPYIGPKCGGYKNRKQKNKVARILHI